MIFLILNRIYKDNSNFSAHKLKEFILNKFVSDKKILTFASQFKKLLH